jgi:DNA-binding transcriptional LysR family regulator
MLHGIALKYFVEVARTGSLAAASESLHVAISSISRQIVKLEQEIGTTLFERLPRGMVLTEPGELLVQHARKALLDAETVLTEISAVRESEVGVIRIGCTEGFTHYFCPSLLASFHAEHPQTRFLLRSGTPAEVEQWVANGDVDIGLAFGTTGSIATSVEVSMSSPVCALMSPSHPLAQKSSLTLDELLNYPVVVLERKTTVRHLIDWCCSARGKELKPVLTTNSSSAEHQFSARTFAITLGSRITLQGMQGDDPTLVARAIDEPILNQRLLQVLVMKDRRLPQTVRRFLTVLKAALQ